MMKNAVGNTIKKRRWISGIVTAVATIVMIASLTACAPAEDARRLAEDERGADTWAAGANTANPATPAANPSATHVSDVTGTVATVNGVYIDAEHVMPEIRRAEHMLRMRYPDSFPFGSEVDEYFAQAIREEAVRIAALTVLLSHEAVRLDISVSEHELQLIDEEIDNLLEFFGQEQFDTLLAEEGFRSQEHLARTFATFQTVENVLQYIIQSPGEFARFEQYMTGEPVTAKAESITARARAGEDFDMLIETYGEDPGMRSNPDGYTFTSGVMVSEFEQGTRELEIGEISDPIRTDFGYHIIKRVEPNLDNLMGGPVVEGTEVLAAKHVLVSGQSVEELKIEAVFLAFEAKIADAEFVFLPELEGIEVCGGCM